MKKLLIIPIIGLMFACNSEDSKGLEVNKKNCFLSQAEFKKLLPDRKERDIFDSKCLTKILEEDWKPPKKPLTKMSEVELTPQ